MISAHPQKSGVVNFTDTVQAPVWSCFFRVEARNCSGINGKCHLGKIPGSAFFFDFAICPSILPALRLK